MRPERKARQAWQAERRDRLRHHGPHARDRRRRGPSCLQPCALIMRESCPRNSGRSGDVERRQVQGPHRTWPGKPGCPGRMAISLILGRGRPVAPTVRDLNRNPRPVPGWLRPGRNTQPRRSAAQLRNRPLRIRSKEPAWQRQEGQSACPQSRTGRESGGQVTELLPNQLQDELPGRQTPSSRLAEKKSAVDIPP